MKKLLCIDGNSILNRQFYGIRYLSTKDNFPTNALFGLVNVIARELERIKPDYCAVAFDIHAPTFRHKMYTEYKAGRHETPEGLIAQMDPAKEICASLGFNVFGIEGYEADDILGTLARMSEEEGVQAYVLTGDRDSLQLISDNVNILLATNTETVIYDNDKFFEKYGVNASQYVDVKALMGDSSDNIPGVRGIGEKTAFKLISEWGSLDSLYDNIEIATLTPSVRTKLSDGKESAYMSRTLATIDKNVPIGLTLAEMGYKGVNIPEAKKLFERYELYSGIKKFGLDCEEDAEQKNQMSVPEIENVTCEFINALDGVTYAFDFDGENIFVSDGKNIYKTEFDSEIAAFLNSKRIVMYDCKSIYKALEMRGIHYRGCNFDIMLGAYAQDSTVGNYTLERLAMIYFGEEINADMPPVWYTYRLLGEIEKKLTQTNQVSLLYDIEMPLAGVLCDMEIEGVKIDCEGIADYGVELEETAKRLEGEIYSACGHEFNINSPKQLGEVLFGELMLPGGKKTKSGYSTNAEILEKLRRYHPIIDNILEYRRVTKLKSTYVDGLLRGADMCLRVHTTFKQTGTATGRLSSTEPNLQNIPIRTEAGRRFRKYFIPTNSDNVLIDADYSQIELRVLAHISNDENMIEAFASGMDIHTSTACRVFGVLPEDVTIQMRKKAKAINFGILYGMGEYRLSEDLGINIYEAKEYIDNYLASYPSIAKYLTDVVSQAKKDGYVTTMFSRRRVIPELKAQNKNIQHAGERVAMNSPIQGSAADIIKIAMINVDKKLKESGTGAKLILQVHDELLVESPANCAKEVMEILAHEMEHAVKLLVPLDVQAAIGKTWYECH